MFLVSSTGGFGNRNWRFEDMLNRYNYLIIKVWKCELTQAQTFETAKKTKSCHVKHVAVEVVAVYVTCECKST